MISAEEQCRRLLLLCHAVAEARETLMTRLERDCYAEATDWFGLEEYNDMVEENRRVSRRLEVAQLQAAYEGPPLNVRCTAQERSDALRVAIALLEGDLPMESTVDRFCCGKLPRGMGDEP